MCWPLRLVLRIAVRDGCPSLVGMGDLSQCVALDHPKEYPCPMSSDEEELTNEQAELMALCEQLWLLEKENR